MAVIYHMHRYRLDTKLEFAGDEKKFHVKPETVNGQPAKDFLCCNRRKTLEATLCVWQTSE